jgi:hypothetical protein
VKFNIWALSACVSLTFSPSALFAENIRVNIAETLELTKEKTSGGVLQLGAGDSAAVFLDNDTRFFRGIEVELTAPQLWLANHGSLAMAIYTAPSKLPVRGTQEFTAVQLRADVIAARIQSVYQIPVRKNHNLRSSAYAAVTPETLPGEFPVIIRLMPLVKDLSEEVQNMKFQLNIRPLLSDEGSARINIRFPPKLQNKPFTMLIDDKLIENPQGEHIFREGEHHLMLISNDYRNESRRFLVERGKTVELNIALQDVTPLLIFEAPDNSRLFLDNIRVTSAQAPKPVEAGVHEVKLIMSDYTIIKTIFVQKGKTYRVAFTFDLSVVEEE